MLKAIIGFITAFGVSMILYPKFITFFNESNIKQAVSEYALDEFKNKAKTATFGGLVFVSVSIFISLFINGFNFSKDLTLLIYLLFSYALIGFIDDYKIIKDGKNDGLKAKHKFLLQMLLAVIFFILFKLMGGSTVLEIPFTKISIDSIYIYLPLVLFLLTGTSNAVNLTDGMDGLAAGTFIISLIPFAWFAYKLERLEILLFIMTLMGALLAFLYYNKKPAKIFMGDVGSLPLGAFLAGLSILMKLEFFLAIFGFVFVFETITVIIQKISWKTRGKRVFRYTPIHYSFTLSGWKEQDVVNIFYIIGIIAMVVGLALSALL